MKEFFQKKENRFFLAVIAALIAFVSWQESQIADLQERMMNIEASFAEAEHRAGLADQETAVGHTGELKAEEIFLRFFFRLFFTERR